MISVTLFEGIVLLAIVGVSVVVWWGIRRLVKMSDDAALCLANIDKSIAKICGRLGKSDVWMDLHSKQDDDRHEEIKSIFDNLWDAIDRIRKV